jgi:hypothetical protein
VTLHSYQRSFAIAMFVALSMGAGRTVLGQGASVSRAREITGVVVDEAGNAVAGVDVDIVAPKLEKPARTDEKGEFRFWVAHEGRLLGYDGLVVARDGDARLGMALPGVRLDDTFSPMRITLRVPRVIKVRVVDEKDRPIEGAQVYFEIDRARFPLGSTDAKGDWSVRVPDEPKNWRLAAFKGGVGYDYESPPRNPNLARNDPTTPLPSELTLRLDGARPPVRIKTVDHLGKPVPRVWILISSTRGNPLLGFAKPGKVNNGLTPRLVTGDDGLLTLDWLPRETQGELSYRGMDMRDKYSAQEAAGLVPDPETGEVKCVMVPKQVVSGRITLADGKPASKAQVRIISLLAHQSQRVTETDENGRYTASVKSQEAYVVYASLNEASQFRGQAFVVTTEKPVEDIDLVIKLGSEVTGRVLLNRDSTPVRNVGKFSVWTHTRTLAPEIQALLPGNPKLEQVEILTVFQTMDKEFRLPLPPGNYILRFSHFVNGKEQVHDLPITIPLFFTPREIKRDLILSEIPKVK